MSKKTFFVTTGSEIGCGNTIKEAYEDLQDKDDCRVDECTFYEATEIQVEVIFQKKEVVSSISKKVDHE